VYEVEKILDLRETNGETEYLIRWKVRPCRFMQASMLDRDINDVYIFGLQGWDSRFDTWEPAHNLGNCKKLVQKFEESRQAALPVVESEYEKRRKENLKRNQQFLQQLKLAGLDGRVMARHDDEVIDFDAIPNVEDAEPVSSPDTVTNTEAVAVATTEPLQPPIANNDRAVNSVTANVSVPAIQDGKKQKVTEEEEDRYPRSRECNDIPMDFVIY
jgi:hypothetical protein